MNTTEKCRRWDWICTIGWGMLFVINMISYIWTKHPLSLFCAGFMLGGCLIFLITIPHMHWQDRFIDKILKDWRVSIKNIENYYHAEFLKKMKGGKKKR